MDYIFKRYGSEHVALLGSCPKFEQDGIIRQLGKVYGLLDEEINALQRSKNVRDAIGRKILHYAKILKGLPYIYQYIHVV